MYHFHKVIPDCDSVEVLYFRRLIRTIHSIKAAITHTNTQVDTISATVDTVRPSETVVVDRLTRDPRNNKIEI